MMTNTVGEWDWAGAEKRLNISARKEHSLASLNGQWRLSDFGRMLDGLSLRRLSRSLSDGSSNVTCELRLASGQAFQMVGAFTSESNARGVLVEQSQSIPEEDEPGPALVPVFQPILSLTTGQVVGFEALARWPTEDDEHQGFDDQALASNMMIHACQALSVWRNESKRGDLFVQVNLTSRDLVDDSLVDLVTALISGHDLKEGRLRLELTEQAALRDADRAVEVATALRDAGAALVLDDFGSGHSSFLWLANLPADSLKVDADLIAQIGRPRVKTILEALTLLARRLGMHTTAEGVEDVKVLSILREIGFDYVQGFALGHPMTLEDTQVFLIEHTDAA